MSLPVGGVQFSKLITPFLAHTVQRAMMGVSTDQELNPSHHVQGAWVYPVWDREEGAHSLESMRMNSDPMQDVVSPS